MVQFTLHATIEKIPFFNVELWIFVVKTHWPYRPCIYKQIPYLIGTINLLILMSYPYFQIMDMNYETPCIQLEHQGH